jgi:hypothetical protein
MLKKIIGLLFLFGGIVALAQNPSVVPVATPPTTCYQIPLYEYQAGSTVYVSGPGNTCVALGTASGGDSITSPNSTISVGGTATATTLDINLAHANTWTANQTSAKWIASTGFDITGATTSGHYLRNNGTDYVDSALQSGDITTALGYTPANCTAGTANGNCITNGMTTLGDWIYGGASGAATRLAGPTGAASTTYMLTEATNGSSVAQAPTWTVAPVALASASHKWLNSFTASTGAFTQTQPASSDLSDYIADVTFTVSSSTTINANSCSPASSSAGTSVTMTGLASTNALVVTPNSDITNTTGWGNPAAGVLYITVAPGSGAFTYHVCNNTSSNITTGGSATFNVGAK